MEPHLSRKDDLVKARQAESRDIWKMAAWSMACAVAGVALVFALVPN